MSIQKNDSERTDQELVEYADAIIDGGSTVEMMRRLKDATVEQQKTMNRLTTGLLWFTVALVVFGAIQIGIVIAK